MFSRNLFLPAQVSRLLTGLIAIASVFGASSNAWAVAPDDYEDEPPWSLTMSTGLDFTTGDYGSNTKTDTWYVPLGVKFEFEPIILKVTVPYLIIDGDGSVVGGGDGGVITGSGLFNGINDGLGDVILSGSYVYFPDASWLPVTELTGKVKFPTGDEDKDLGTGEFDYTIQLDVSKAFGRVTPLGTVGYRFMGDPPGLDLNDFLFASGGLSLRLGEGVSVGAIYDWRDNSSPQTKDKHEAVGFASFDLSERLSFNPYGVVGLSKYASDWGLGFQVGVTFGRY